MKSIGLASRTNCKGLLVALFSVLPACATGLNVTGDASTGGGDTGTTLPSLDAGHDGGVIVMHDSGVIAVPDGGTPPGADTGTMTGTGDGASDGASATDGTLPPSDAMADAAGDTGMTSPDAHGSPDTGTGTGDSGSCVTVTVPTGNGGAGSCSAGEPTCEVSTAGFTATTPGSVKMPGACSTTDIQNYYSACLDANTGSVQACQNYSTQSPTCYACIAPVDASASSWGPLISVGPDAVLNIGGCISMLEPCNSACAAAAYSIAECESASCSTCSSATKFNDCVGNVDSCDPNGCASQNVASTCETSLTGANHPASICVPSTSFADTFPKLAAVFCGGS